MKEDRVIVGFISGIVAASIQDILMLGFKGLGWTKFTYTDLGKIIIMYKPFPGTLAFFIGTLAHLIFGGLLGYGFAIVVKNTASRYFVLKLLLWGPLLWFASLGMGTVFKMPLFTVVSPLTALMLLIGDIIFSLISGYILHYFDEKTKLL